MSSPVGCMAQNRADTVPDGCSNRQKPDQNGPDLSSPVEDDLTTYTCLCAIEPLVLGSQTN